MPMMTNDEAAKHMREGSPLWQVQAVVSDTCGMLEQAEMQRRPPSPIEARAMLLDATNRIIDKAVDVGLVIRT